MSNLPTKKQLRAYFLVEVLGETKSTAAKIMGITRQTVSRWLKRFYENKKDEKLTSKKQLRVYFLVEVMGKRQAEAAEIMGVSRTAVTRLLDRFYKYERPRHKGKAAHTMMSLPGDWEGRVTDIF